MTFKELTFRDELLGAAIEEKSFWKSLLGSQSPIMKVWFFIMLVNMVLFLFVLR